MGRLGSRNDRRELPAASTRGGPSGATTGRRGEGDAAVRPPVPFINQVRIASKHYRAGEFEAALAAARQASELADRWQALAAEHFRGDDEPTESELEAVFKDNSLVAKNLHVLGQIQSEMGDYDEALPNLERSVEIFRRLSPKMDLALSEALHALATTHLNLGDHDTAERLFEEALAIREHFAAEHMPRLPSPLAEYD